MEFNMSGSLPEEKFKMWMPLSKSVETGNIVGILSDTSLDRDGEFMSKELIEKFANYGFNKSHAAAYSVVAFQTAYLKAHHPANYMAAVLAHNMADLNKLNQLISECNRIGYSDMTSFLPHIIMYQLVKSTFEQPN